MSVRKVVHSNAFGEYLTGRLRHLQLTSSAFADSVGIARSTVCDMEKGRRFPSLARLPRWAEVLQTHTAFITQLLLQQRVDEAGLSLSVRVKDP